MKIWEDGKVSQGELNIFIDRLLTLIKADHSKRHLERIIEMCDIVLGKLGSRYEWYRNKIEEIKHEFQGRLNSLE